MLIRSSHKSLQYQESSAQRSCGLRSKPLNALRASGKQAEHRDGIPILSTSVNQLGKHRSPASIISYSYLIVSLTSTTTRFPKLAATPSGPQAMPPTKSSPQASALSSMEEKLSTAAHTPTLTAQTPTPVPSTLSAHILSCACTPQQAGKHSGSTAP